ncbi:hypothetical protein G9A89_008880 [Geosiphon pyriformis]|nr:hypothetical protein G9A89_008880 [Geosiphon pyriformis]
MSLAPSKKRISGDKKRLLSRLPTYELLSDVDVFFLANESFVGVSFVSACSYENCFYVSYLHTSLAKRRKNKCFLGSTIRKDKSAKLKGTAPSIQSLLIWRSHTPHLSKGMASPILRKFQLISLRVGSVRKKKKRLFTKDILFAELGRNFGNLWIFSRIGFLPIFSQESLTYSTSSSSATASTSFTMRPSLQNGRLAVFDTSKARDMWETAFIIAFCDKFKAVLKNIEFWPEELEQALYSTSSDELLENIHCVFLTNVLNRKKAVDRNQWKRVLSETIDQHLKKRVDFYVNYNPMRSVKNNNYYELKVEDRVSILYSLVNWQLKECKSVRDLIDTSYKNRQKTEDTNPLKVEIIGKDRKNANYYFVGNAARIYREGYPKRGIPLTHENIKWGAITTSLNDVKNFTDDPNQLKPKSFINDRALHAKLKGYLIPKVEELTQAKDKKDEKRKKQERTAQRMAMMHANAAVYLTRTRSASKKAGVSTANGSDSLRSNSYYNDYEFSLPYPTGTSRRTGKRTQIEGSNKGLVISNSEAITDLFKQELDGDQAITSKTARLTDDVASESIDDMRLDFRPDIPVNNNTGVVIDNSINGDTYSLKDITEGMSQDAIKKSTNGQEILNHLDYGQRENHEEPNRMKEIDEKPQAYLENTRELSSNQKNGFVKYAPTSREVISISALPSSISLHDELFGKDTDTDLSDIWDNSESESDSD